MGKRFGKASFLSRVAGAAVVLLAALTTAPPASAFDVFLQFEGGINDNTKARIKEVMQKEFTGAGAALTVTDDPEKKDGAVRLVRFINDFSDPKGDRWGDSGDGKTTNVYVKEFTQDPAVSGNFNTDATLGNGLGETAAHEVGHTYGLNHNEDNPRTKMTQGGNVTAVQRAADARSFNKDDALLLKVNSDPGILDLIPRPLGNATNVLVVAFETPTPVADGKLEDLAFLDAGLTISGPYADQMDLGYYVAATDGGLTFGTRSAAPFRDPSVGLGRELTLANGDLLHWALRDSITNEVFSLADYGIFDLLGPRFNPFVGMMVYGLMNAHWDVDGDGVFGDVAVTLNADAILGGTSNGFRAVPEPGTFGLLISGLLLAGLFTAISSVAVKSALGRLCRLDAWPDMARVLPSSSTSGRSTVTWHMPLGLPVRR